MAHQRTRGPRKEKDWGEIVSGFFDLTADGNTVIGSSIPGVSSTVIRMIGEYFITPTPGGTFAANDEVELVIGIGVMSTAAVTVGGASVASPHSEPGFPWLYRLSHVFSMEDATPSPSGFAQAGRWSFDIRSMRKMKASESLVAIVNYADNSGAPPMTVGWGSTRVLFAGL